MSKQFENPEAEKLEDKTISEASEQERIEHVAENAAEKASKTEKRYDGEHTIFSN
jgi:hypothetical protein